MPVPNQPITLHPEKITCLLGIITALLLAAHTAGQLIKYVGGHDYALGFVPLFDLNDENNVPTFFSTGMLLFATSLVAILAILKKSRVDPYAMHWAGLTAIFLFLSLDEAASMHEILTLPMRRLVGGKGPFYFAWIIPGMILVIIVGLSYLRFVFNLRKRTKAFFFCSAVIYLAGAVGIEMVSGPYAELYGQRNLTFSFLAAAEETLEMAGIVLFIYALLDYMRVVVEEVRIRVGSK